MKKQLLITGIAILLLAVALSGCTTPSNGFGSTSTFKLLSCLYYPNENKVLITINRSSSDSFTCWIVDSEGSIGSGCIGNVEQATYIELSKRVYPLDTYGLIVKKSEEIVYTVGLQFQENNSVDIVDWEMPYLPTFRLVSWEQTYDSEYHIALLLRFQCSDDVSFHILDSKGIEVGRGIAGFTERKILIHFNYDTFNATFFNQTFKLVVTKEYFSGEIIHEEEIKLNNTVSLSIIDAVFNWEEYHWNNLDKYKISNFSFTIRNDGDFPIYSGAYVYGHRLPKVGNHFRVIFLGEEYEFDIGLTLNHDKISSFGLIQPGKEITTTVFLESFNHKILADHPGIYNITTILDYYDSTTSITTITKVGSAS